MTQKVTKKDGTVILTEVYTYKESNGQPTTQVASHTTQNAAGTVVSSYTYSYDANGNITEICDVTTATHYSTTYQYDSANQLIRENNQRRGTTWTWEYDNAGNILSRTEYAYTTGNLGTPTDTINYDYDDSAWGDLLTTYDGSAITYDTVGNPLDDGTWEYTWEHGRQLASMTNAGSDPLDETTVTYTYDANGMRTGKTVVHSYHTHSYASAVTAPTCTEAGYTTHVCASCGDSYVDSATQATGHSYTSVVTPPTCVEEGYTTHTCASCGDSYTDSIVPVTDHSGYTVSTVAPTCTEDGCEEYYCETCGCLYSVTLPATGHNGSFLSGEPATCTEDGCEYYYCSTCAEVYEVVIPCPGHTMTGDLVPWCIVCNYNRPGDPAFWSLRSDSLLNTVETTSHSYVYNGGQLSRMTVTTVTETADGQTSTQTHTVDLTYDASGNPQTMTYDGTTYYYTVNIQGDVTGIVDESGNVLVRYYYQGYGITYYSVPAGDLGETLVKINPLIYRGYVYDKETKLYYLQSRYYNRTSGRFINADDVDYLGVGSNLTSYNLFAYCGNNPVMGYDPTGHWDWGGVIAGLSIIAGTIIAVATFGVATPLAVIAASAAIATGAVTTYAAATDSTMTVDVSVSIPTTSNTYAKYGVSVVVDFEEDEANLYYHGGVGYGRSSGISYSTGMVANYEEPSDYSGSFTDVFYGPIDHCWTPQDGVINSTQANCVSFSSGIGFGVGYDYYSKPVRLFGW